MITTIFVAGALLAGSGTLSAAFCTASIRGHLVFVAQVLTGGVLMTAAVLLERAA
jgi:hypothetical protein